MLYRAPPPPLVLSYNFHCCWSLCIVIGPYVPIPSHEGTAHVCEGTAQHTLQQPPPYDLPHCTAHQTAQTATLGIPIWSSSHEGAARVYKSAARVCEGAARHTSPGQEGAAQVGEGTSRATRAQPELRNRSSSLQGRYLGMLLLHTLNSMS